ncbi:disease resistance protein RPM1-like isoform X1 [Carex littledalei]|uniref:Disease resistance protein RPM1-like isoform X1 n=1 Tax=Carex littledalei TaxID=544730 RepID=A0A833RB16_9POAL|nr:disease resistance protein RPM1-like isoform X1 [Carex littledalei]
MEEAAKGVANTALNLVVKTAITAITNEIGLILGVQEELFFIKEELEMMQAFLQAASTQKVKGVVVTTWIKQVQELAFDVEDCLQEASVHLMKKPWLPVMCSVKKRDNIARKIRVLKTRIEDVSKRNLRYKLIHTENGGHIYDESASTKSIANVEALLVGLDEPKRKLVELILKEDGETRSDISSRNGWSWKDHSCQRDDLSSVSEWDKIKDVLPMVNGSRIIVTTRLRPLAESISHPSDNIYEIKELSENDAFDLFFKAVYKTPNYRLVIEHTKKKDDPRDKSKCDMKYGTSSSEIIEQDSEVKKERITITKDMKIQADLIIESCGRLPLAIVTIGSYLATKPKTSVEWKTMHEQLSSELANNPNLGTVKNVLTSSYDGMPYHLKPCLLYLSVFHNHKEIRRSRIIRRWMADGYVMEGRKKTAEEVGKSNFYDIMGRNLIQPSQMDTIVNGDVKRCNIHDMMYELILAKAVDENIVSLLEDENLITMTDKVRHLVIAGGPCTGDNILERVKLSHMRSLSIFGEVGDYLRYPRMKLVRVLDLEGTLNLNDRDLRSIGKLRHLKYLGLRGTKITKLPDSLGKLSELETLDIRNTAVVRLPTGLTKLQKLSYLRAGSDDYFYHPTPMRDTFNRIDWDNQLNLGDNFVSCGVRLLTLLFCVIPILPCYILEKFEESKVDRFSGGVRAPQGIGELRSLKILGIIDIGRSKDLAKEIQNLTNLSKLAVTGFTRENGKTIAEVIDGLKHLKSLVLKAKDESGLGCCLDSISSPPKYLKSLKLHSPLGKLPNWISSLENLEKIHFKCTYLTGGIEVIEKLPNLKILYMLVNSFLAGVEELRFREGTFPMLEVMNLEELLTLESVSIEETALKRLEQLKISKCWSIKENGVSGLDFLVQLKEMEVVYKDTNLVKNIQEQLKKLPKNPVLRLIKI